MSYESLDYEIIEKENPFEIRLYEEYNVAEVALEKGDKMGSAGFRHIFNYISGRNANKESIAMTVPVLNREEGSKYVTSFVMPKKYKDKPLPLPDDPEVKIEKVPQKKMAAYRFSGSVLRERVTKYEKMLSQWLEKKGYHKLSEARLARYNSPFSLPILRRNEILIEVEKFEKKS